jgi:hypothetical protein
MRRSSGQQNNEDCVRHGTYGAGSTGFCWLREKFSAQANIEVRTIDLEQPIIACGLIMRCSISYSAFLCSVVLGRRFAADIPRAWLLIINGLQSSNTPKEQHGEL